MSTVIMDRGNTSKLFNIPYTNGLIYFNTEDKCIYLDDGTKREIYGGTVQKITTPSGASNNNVLTAKATVDYFPQKTDILDTANGINSNTSADKMVGCNGFKAIVGTTDISNVGSNVKNAIATLGTRLSVNGNKFVFDYQDGKWGFNTSEERGADTFHPFNSTNLSIFTNADYSTNDGIEASNVNLKVSATTVSNATNIPINFMKGSCVTTYWSEGNDSVGYGDVVHLFDDQDGKTDAGSHEHYVWDSSWHKSTTAPSPLKTLETTADLGLPFVIKTITKTASSIIPTDYDYIRKDDLYFYVCVNNTVKIYKYIVSDNEWSGTWQEIPTARLDLTSNDAYTHYTIGSRHTIIVYKNELHIIGGQYTYNGDQVADTKHYVWNPTTNEWRILSTVSADLINHCCGMLIHNNKVYAMCADSLYGYYTYNGFEWSDFNTITLYNTQFDKESAFIDYNGELHWFGGTTNPKLHAKLVDTDNTCAKYANLAYNYKDGGIALTQDFTNVSGGTVLLHTIDDRQVDSNIKFIRLFGTSQPNTDSTSYRKYHRTVQDTYKASIYNEKDYIEVDNT